MWRVHPDETDKVEDVAQFVCNLARFKLGKFLTWLPQQAEESQVRLGLLKAILQEKTKHQS